MAELPDLRHFTRMEAPPAQRTLIVRGGLDSAVKLRRHAERVRRAFVLDGEAVLGISVFAALDDIGPASLDAILTTKLSTYRLLHIVPVSGVVAAGFRLLPTFERPHMTLLLDHLGQVDDLLATLGPPQLHPQYHGHATRRSRKRPR